MRNTLIIGLFLVFLTMGCSAGDSALETTPTAQHIDFLFPWEDEGSPTNVRELEATLLDDFYTHEAATAHCFLDEGYEYQRRTITIDYTHGKGVVLTMAESLTEHGFGIADGEGNRGVNVEIRGGDLINGEYQNYVEAGGTCYDQQMVTDIQVALTDGTSPDAWLPDRLLADSEFLKSEQAWSRCMHTRGFEGYGTLNDTGADIFEESMSVDVDLDSLKKKEIEAARAFLGCYIEHLDPAIRSFHGLSPA